MNELENYLQLFARFLANSNDAPIEIIMNNGNSFHWWVIKEEGVITGVKVDNLGDKPFLSLHVFNLVINFLYKDVNKTRQFGNALNFKLGEGLASDSIEGYIGSMVYGYEIGDWVFRRIIPIKYILQNSGICNFQHGDGLLSLVPNYIINKI